MLLVVWFIERCGRMGQMMHYISESLKLTVLREAEPNLASADLQEVASRYYGVIIVRNTIKLSDYHLGECF